MKRMNSVLKTFIGLLFMIASAVIFTYCNPKQEQPQRDTTTTSETGDATNMPPSGPAKGDRWSEVRERVNKDEKELNSEMRELETKATRATSKVKGEIHKTTSDIKAERDKIKSDSLNPEFSNVWDSFLSKSRSTLDSLRKKI